MKFEVGYRVRVTPVDGFYHCADATRRLPAPGIGVVEVASLEAAAANPIADLPYLVEFGVPICPDCDGTNAWFLEEELSKI